jgi:hypothetical protein
LNEFLKERQCLKVGALTAVTSGHVIQLPSKLISWLLTGALICHPPNGSNFELFEMFLGSCEGHVTFICHETAHISAGLRAPSQNVAELLASSIRAALLKLNHRSCNSLEHCHFFFFFFLAKTPNLLCPHVNRPACWQREAIYLVGLFDRLLFLENSDGRTKRLEE